jgi:hypothetical protein
MWLIADERARAWLGASLVLFVSSSCVALQVASDPEGFKVGGALQAAYRSGDTTAFASLLGRRQALGHNAKGQPGYLSGWLKRASREGRTEIVKVLLDAGADVSYKESSHGRTALMLAANTGYPEIVEMLISHGANVADTDSAGNTALMEASGAGRIATIQVLIAAGADVNQKTADGMTALSYAVQEQMDEAVYVLLQAGADPNVSARRLLGREAMLLSLARESSNPSRRIIELLERAEARE